MRPRAVHDDQEDLMGELESLRTRGVLDIYLNDGKKKPLRLPVLFGLAQRDHPSFEDEPEAARIEIIIGMIRGAIGRLSSDRLRNTPVASPITWQSAALIMYGLVKFRRETQVTIDRIPGQQYVKLARYVKQVSEFVGSDEAFKDLNQQMRGELATFLLSDEAESDTDEIQDAVNTLRDGGGEANSRNAALDNGQDGSSVSKSGIAEIEADHDTHRTVINNSYGIQTGGGNTMNLSFGNTESNSGLI